MSRNYRFLFLTFFFILSACAEKPSGPEKLSLTPVSFSVLPGWGNDQSAESIPALQRSCQTLLIKPASRSVPGTGQVFNETNLCKVLEKEPPRNDIQAKLFFETWFQPYAVSSSEGRDGLFTGYYEAELRGSFTKDGIYQTPLYMRPKDLIAVDLGDFKPDLKGQHISGKVEGSKLKPYDERSSISSGSLAGRAEVLLWVDDPSDAFFLEVQGSGRVRMTDGTVRRLGYDGANGRSYVALGRAMADQGLIDKPVTMQKIRSWLKEHRSDAQRLMNLNPSYVFFRQIEGDGPIGAEGVALTPERSLAIDPAFMPYGVPVWLDTKDADNNVLEKILITQDTGGAIKGPVRGDFFWGFGPKAETEAGSMQSRGSYFILLPKENHD